MAEESRGAKAREGGWGWMIVAGCFLANICVRAVTRCVSIFFVEFQQHFQKDYASTAWIHSTIDGITMFCAPLGGFLGNHFSSRSIVMVGGLLSFSGMVLSSFASSLMFLYVSMGLVTGLGFALSYTPSVAMVGNYFHERKALAYGIGLSGSGIGTFILAPAVQLLIDLYSWRGALLVLGGFVGNLCVCGALLRPVKPRSEPEDRSPKERFTPVIDSQNNEVKTSDLTKEDLALLELTQQNIFNHEKRMEDKMVARLNQQNIFNKKKTVEDKMAAGLNQQNILNYNEKTVEEKMAAVLIQQECTKGLGFLLRPELLIFLVSVLFMAFGCSAPLVYLVPYSLSVGVQHRNAAFLMSIFGISSIVGNVTFGWISDRQCVKKYRLLSYAAAILVEGLCCLLLPWLRSFPLLAACVALYGYFDGAYVALIPVVVSDMVEPAVLTPALGVVYFLHAVPYLLSPPIGGLLVDSTGAYTSTFHLCGASYLVSAGILTTAIVAKLWHGSKSRSVV